MPAMARQVYLRNLHFLQIYMTKKRKSERLKSKPKPNLGLVIGVAIGVAKPETGGTRCPALWPNAGLAKSNRIKVNQSKSNQKIWGAGFPDEGGLQKTKRIKPNQSKSNQKVIWVERPPIETRRRDARATNRAAEILNFN
jgi:hypothetical protein